MASADPRAFRPGVCCFSSREAGNANGSPRNSDVLRRLRNLVSARDFPRRTYARLFLDVLQSYRVQRRYLLHEFVVMPEHFHLLLTPAPDVSLEKVAQLIKGGFSFRVKHELGLAIEVWQPGPQNHRIRDIADYARHVEYICQNPVKRHLAKIAQDYPYSSASGAFDIDPPPPGLKAQARRAICSSG